MNYFVSFMQAFYNGFQNIQLNIYGVSFSLWDLFLWSAIAGILMSFLGGFIFGSEG